MQESPVCENRVGLTQFIVHQVHDCGQVSLVTILQWCHAGWKVISSCCMTDADCIGFYLLVSDFHIGLASTCRRSGCDSSRRRRFPIRHFSVVCLRRLSRRVAVHGTRAWRSRPKSDQCDNNHSTSKRTVVTGSFCGALGTFSTEKKANR